jgi:hypothetical protein
MQPPRLRSTKCYGFVRFHMWHSLLGFNGISTWLPSSRGKMTIRSFLRCIQAKLQRKSLLGYIVDNQLTSPSDMANIELPWEVEGLITPETSVSAMLKVIPSKGIQHSGTFWTWEDKARTLLYLRKMILTNRITALSMVKVIWHVF